MRCKCCDNPKTKYVLGDYYCAACSKSIHDTMFEDRLVYDLTWWEDSREGRGEDDSGE